MYRLYTVFTEIGREERSYICTLTTTGWLLKE
jgi:hypothetical protein